MARALLVPMGEVLLQVGSLPGDSDEIRLQKRLLLLSNYLLAPLGLAWGLTYLAFGEPLAAAIPLIYVALIAVSLTTFGLTRRFRFYRISQMLFMLVLPFALMIALGGFVNSSAVILWSLVSPLAVFFLTGRHRAVPWFVAYLVLLVISAWLAPYLRQVNNLPEWLITLFFTFNISAVSLVVFVMLYSFVREKDAALDLLRREREKSDRLLLNVLPAEIALLLKDEVRTIAEEFAAVTVLFADVVGFTPLSAQLSAGEMVALLHEIFSYFDALVARDGLEKVRTIGDNYMVVAGAPRRRDDHAEAIARLALDMMAYVSGRDFPLQFRIGINSGPAIAGVIGVAKFHYDLWGDAVNTASRMESHGVPGQIQITRATYELVKDRFNCRPRGLIEVKGKGEMETWFLEGVRELAAAATNRPAARHLAAVAAAPLESGAGR
jgi:guanylate cyclase